MQHAELQALLCGVMQVIAGRALQGYMRIKIHPAIRSDCLALICFGLDHNAFAEAG